MILFASQLGEGPPRPSAGPKEAEGYTPPPPGGSGRTHPPFLRAPGAPPSGEASPPPLPPEAAVGHHGRTPLLIIPRWKIPSPPPPNSGPHRPVSRPFVPFLSRLRSAPPIPDSPPPPSLTFPSTIPFVAPPPPVLLRTPGVLSSAGFRAAGRPTAVTTTGGEGGGVTDIHRACKYGRDPHHHRSTTEGGRGADRGWRPRR